MSDTRVAMSEFRLLDDKRKLSPLSYAEEQRWIQLGQSLGIFDSAGLAPPPAASQAPADGPMEVDSGDILEVDPGDVMLVEPGSVQAQQAAPIPRSDTFTGQAPGAGPGASHPGPSSAQGSPSALEDVLRLDFSRTHSKVEPLAPRADEGAVAAPNEAAATRAGGKGATLPRAPAPMAQLEPKREPFKSPPPQKTAEPGVAAIDLLESESESPGSGSQESRAAGAKDSRMGGASLAAAPQFSATVSAKATISYVEQAPSPDRSAVLTGPPPVLQPPIAPAQAMPRPQPAPAMLRRQPAPELAPVAQPKPEQGDSLGGQSKFGDGTQMLSGTFVQGEHRVVIHTVEGQVMRGKMRDIDLMSDSLPLELQSGGSTQSIPVKRIKAIFFLISPEMKRPPSHGEKVRVSFPDGREVVGFSNDHKSSDPGFFVTPADARTNTARIYVFRWSVVAVTEF